MAKNSSLPSLRLLGPRLKSVQVSAVTFISGEWWLKTQKNESQVHFLYHLSLLKGKNYYFYDMTEKKKRLVVFDDDEDLLNIFRFLFEDEGWKVETFSSCDEVIAVTQNIKPDLILMDNWIPSIGGIEATQLLKSHPDLRKIPVVYVSANNEIKELSIRAGADGFMAKPFDFSALMQLANSLVIN